MNDGGPAFPYHTKSFALYDGTTVAMPDGYVGMSLRDWFAGQALVMSGPILAVQVEIHGQDHSEFIARRCYSMADAMLKARELK